MLVFLDETWQSFESNPKEKICVLSAVAIRSTDFNEFSRQLRNFKYKHLGITKDAEIKGKDIFKRYYFRLEKKGIVSSQLSLARDTFKYAISHNIKAFASIVLDQQEIDLSCADDKLLERPFLFLFERINLFMQEEFPDQVASLIFDLRGITQNEKISRSVSNFFHLSQYGRAFDRIIKVPYFAISSENAGIQLADMVGHVIGKEFTTDNKREIQEFHRHVKDIEFKSKSEFEHEGKKYHRYGFKFIKQKDPKKDGP